MCIKSEILFKPKGKGGDFNIGGSLHNYEISVYIYA